MYEKARRSEIALNGAMPREFGLLRKLASGDEELGGAVRGALGGPHQVFAVGGENGQHVSAFLVGDAGFLRAVVAHQVELVVGVTVGAGGVDEVPAGRV